MRAPTIALFALSMVAPLTAASSYFVALQDASGDARFTSGLGNGLLPPQATTGDNCGRTDFLSASLARGASGYTLRFRVLNAFASCFATNLVEVHYPVYEREPDGTASFIFANVDVAPDHSYTVSYGYRNDQFGRYSGANLFASGEAVVAIPLSAGDLPVERAFRMSALVSNACPGVCVYTHRDEIG